jgi:dTDP-4-dehydrorhamnose 3,5-epimerase-like enzyme
VRKIDPYEAFRDHRGEIRDLLRDETFEGATLIFTKAGNVRGNHYHARTAQFTYVLTGSLLVVTQEPGGIE